VTHNHNGQKWHPAEELNGRLAMLGFVIAAERFNGWAAMLGFVAAVGAYATTGQIIPGIF